MERVNKSFREWTMGQLLITKNSESERATMEVLDLMTVERRRMGEDDPEVQK